jgi:hypothetical protein
MSTNSADIDTTANADWIECGLPWDASSTSGGPHDYKSPPDFSDRVREQFGFTKKELEEQTFGKYALYWDSPVYKEYSKISDELEEQLIPTLLDTNNLTNNLDKEVDALLKSSTNESVKAVLAYFAKTSEIDEFIASQLEYLETEAYNDKLDEEYQSKLSISSFTGAGLALAGTLIEVKKVDGTMSQMLIGNINELGGVCDDCTDIRSDDIIIRYKRIWTPPASDDVSTAINHRAEDDNSADLE